MSSHNSHIDKDIYFEMDFSPGEDEENFYSHNDYRRGSRHLTPSTLIFETHQASPSQTVNNVSQPRNISRSVTLTPSSSVSNTASPSSGLIPRLLRESFSKILHRRHRTPEPGSRRESQVRDNDNGQEDIGSSSISPETQAIVKESIKNGLPIIPFASPTFYGNSKKSDSLVKEDQLQPPSLSECCEADDDIFLMDHDHEEESLPSLNSIVRRAKHEVDNLEDNSVTRKQSQSSYVEMIFNNKDRSVDREITPEIVVDEKMDNDDSEYFIMDKRKSSLKKNSVIHNSVPCDLFR